jgi:fumarylacetoacetase
MRPGDLIATGTLSGPSRRELGCLLEATVNGTDPYEMPAVSSEDVLVRAYLQDGDIIEFRAQADDESGLGKVGFGTCAGQVLPSA